MGAGEFPLSRSFVPEKIVRLKARHNILIVQALATLWWLNAKTPTSDHLREASGAARLARGAGDEPRLVRFTIGWAGRGHGVG